MIKLDGFDDAIIGPAMIWCGQTMDKRLVYDAEMIREILMNRDGMSHEDAREFIEFNIEGAYVGPNTPVLVWNEDSWYDDEDESWKE
jgi:hypothetical protein